MFARGSNVNIAYRGLELDEGVGLVMVIGRARFAARAEIRIIADSTLVAITNDVRKAFA